MGASRLPCGSALFERADPTKVRHGDKPETASRPRGRITSRSKSRIRGMHRGCGGAGAAGHVPDMCLTCALRRTLPAGPLPTSPSADGDEMGAGPIHPILVVPQRVVALRQQLPSIWQTVRAIGDRYGVSARANAVWLHRQLEGLSIWVKGSHHAIARSRLVQSSAPHRTHAQPQRDRNRPHAGL